MSFKTSDEMPQMVHAIVRIDTLTTDTYGGMPEKMVHERLSRMLANELMPAVKRSVHPLYIEYIVDLMVATPAQFYNAVHIQAQSYGYKPVITAITSEDPPT
jgi:hypothetical protein